MKCCANMDTCCAVLSFSFFTESSFFATKAVLASKNVDELNVQNRNPVARTAVKQRKSLVRFLAVMLTSLNKSE